MAFTGRYQRAEKEWCQTTASEGGVWDVFKMVKSKLCSGDNGFDKPWGPVDLEAVKCQCGEQPVFPDNQCTPDEKSSGCAS
jgi:hypothetical protein